MGTDNYFGRMGRDFDRLQRSTGGYGQGTATGSMKPADYAGIGLQIGGAMLQDKAAEEELAREDELRRIQMMLDARNTRTAAEQFERGAQQTDRSQNQAGFQMLANQRGNAMENARRYSFRNSFAKAIGA